MEEISKIYELAICNFRSILRMKAVVKWKNIYMKCTFIWSAGTVVRVLHYSCRFLVLPVCASSMIHGRVDNCRKIGTLFGRVLILCAPVGHSCLASAETTMAKDSARIHVSTNIDRHPYSRSTGTCTVPGTGDKEYMQYVMHMTFILQVVYYIITTKCDVP